MGVFDGRRRVVMPLWIYECEECGTKVERLIRGKKRRPNPICQECRKKMKWIKYPGSDFQLKGKGWSK